MSNAIYVVSIETNEVLRKSKSFLNAVTFTAELEADSFYLCQSEFDKKKGEIMSNITDFIDI